MYEGTSIETAAYRHFELKQQIDALTKERKDLEAELEDALGYPVPPAKVIVGDMVVQWSKPAMRKNLDRKKLDVLAAERFGTEGTRLITDCTTEKLAKASFTVKPNDDA